MSRRALFCLVLLLMGSVSAVTRPGGGQERPGQGTVLVLEITGAIGPATEAYVDRGLSVAVERQAALLVLRMDTPGGLDSSTRAIVRSILASPIPVATYVAPSGARAASAGTYILYASHVAAMAPGTNLGAATPIRMGGGSQPSEPDEAKAPDVDQAAPDAARPLGAAEAKAVNDAVAYIRGLAELRGRNADWAERAVRQAESLPAHQALQSKVIDVLAADLKAMLRLVDGRTVQVGQQAWKLRTADVTVEVLEAGWQNELLAIITDPNIAYILMLIGIYGIIFEFASPGTVFSGVIGVICLLLGLYALNLLPVNLAGAALLLLGVALMVAEAFAPSFGILGMGGIVAFAIGSALLFDLGEVGFTLSWAVIGAATASSAFLLLLTLGAVIRSRRNALPPASAVPMGAAGRVISWDPGGRGTVFVHGEIWQARSDLPLEPGRPVMVSGRENLTLLVRPAADGPPNPSPPD